MRRVLVLALAVFALAACSDAAPQTAPTPAASGASPGVSASASGGPGSPALTSDAAVTAKVCTDAGKAMTDASAFFTTQMSALEKAAAKGDQDAIVAAATAIQDRLMALTNIVAAYSAKAVTPELRKVLVDATTALTEISSEGYTGTQADIKKQLTTLTAAFAKACG